MIDPDIEFITFDCYGTLIDWESGIITAFQHEAAIDGMSLDAKSIIAAYRRVEPKVEAEYKSYRNVLIETAVRAANELGWEIDSQRASFLPASLPLWKPFSDTNSALERLSRRFRLGILSNTDDDLLALTRRHFTSEFDIIITAQQVKSYKPGLAHFQEAIARSGNGRLLHAAQSYFHDVVPARSLQIPVVWVNRKSERADAGGPLPDYEVNDLSALADLLPA